MGGPAQNTTASTFVLIHGAADVGWSWHLVADELRAHGHDVIAPDLPCDDEEAGLPKVADAVVGAIGDRRDLVVVGHSCGGFTAPLIADRLPVTELVYVAAMIPAPGERPAGFLRRVTRDRLGIEAQEIPGCHCAMLSHPRELAAALRDRSRGRLPTS